MLQNKKNYFLFSLSLFSLLPLLFLSFLFLLSSFTRTFTKAGHLSFLFFFLISPLFSLGWDWLFNSSFFFHTCGKLFLFGFDIGVSNNVGLGLMAFVVVSLTPVKPPPVAVGLSLSLSLSLSPSCLSNDVCVLVLGWILWWFWCLKWWVLMVVVEGYGGDGR